MSKQPTDRAKEKEMDFIDWILSILVSGAGSG
jgi:hypothetical protein